MPTDKLSPATTRDALKVVMRLMDEWIGPTVFTSATASQREASAAIVIPTLKALTEVDGCTGLLAICTLATMFLRNLDVKEKGGSE